MARLTWGATSERFYEIGVDRGVLFPQTGPGVAWNGLISVSENPTGGEPKPAYIDGYKFRNVASSEEFAATIEAFGAPAEFGPCEGNRVLYQGLIATQQPRKSFGFSYRTKIGNADDPDFGYKVHLIYNALASPSGAANATISENAEAPSRSWSITSRPPQISSIRPTAHYVIDTRYTPVGLLSEFESLVYGSAAAYPSLPTVEQLTVLFSTWV